MTTDRESGMGQVRGVFIFARMWSALNAFVAQVRSRESGRDNNRLRAVDLEVDAESKQTKVDDSFRSGTCRR